FAGLIIDEAGHPVGTGYVGDEPMYVVNDAGFRRHIPSEQVDRQVLRMMSDQVKGHEDLLSEQTAKMLGQDDIFTMAAIQNQLKNLDQQFDQVLNTGIPEEGRAYMGMMGFKITINVHGEVVDLQQPGGIEGEGEDE
ncbi:MAG TPA: hypothetical protein VF806_05535, partial [Anaerolineaceae bacterium]